MSLALFDLDNTLIAGDCAQSFSEFMAASKLPTPDDFIETNHQFMADYDAGRLDLDAYMRYTLSPLVSLSWTDVQELVAEFIDTQLPPMLLPKACALLEQHRDAGDEIAIVSASGNHLVSPISSLLGIQHSLAVDLELNEGRVTGNIQGIPTFREGKVARVQEWASERDLDVSRAAFYSDSLNDLPLLEVVAKPVAVDPDSELEAVAKERGWTILSLR